MRRSLLVLILVAMFGVPHAAAGVGDPAETVSRLIDEHVTDKRPCVDVSNPKSPEVDVRPHGCEPRRFSMDMVYQTVCDPSGSCDPRIAKLMGQLDELVGQHVDDVLEEAYDLLYRDCTPACFTLEDPRDTTLLP